MPEFPVIDIPALIQEREEETLDFKRQAESQSGIAELLVAFANAQGGLILFGAAQEPQTREVSLLGVSSEARRPLCERIASAARHSVEPPLPVEITEVTYQDHLFVLCRVAAGLQTVYQINGRVLQRQHDQNATLRLDAIHRLIIERQLIAFEYQPVAGATLADLSFPAVEAHITSAAARRARAFQPAEIARPPQPLDVLKARGCVYQPPDGPLIPTVAGILMFGAHPDQFFDHAGISIAHFYGTTTSRGYRHRWDLLDLRLPDLINAAAAILWEHIDHAGILPGTALSRTAPGPESRTQRQDQPEYPAAVLRELITNAVAHRDYHNQGTRIRLSLFEDRLELVSPGGLAGHVTLATILHEQYSRNPKITRLLYEQGFIEEEGMGLDNIVEWLYSEGRPPALVQDLGTSIHVTLPSPFATPDAYPPPQPNLVLIQRPAPAIITPAAAAPPAPHPAPPGDLLPTSRRLRERHEAQQAILGYLAQHGPTLLEDLARLVPQRTASTTHRDIIDLLHRGQVRQIYLGRRSYYGLPHQGPPTARHLDPRQLRAIEYVREHGRITNREYRDLDVGIPNAPPVAQRTASNDLAALVERGLLQATGTGRNKHFVLPPGATSPESPPASPMSD